MESGEIVEAPVKEVLVNSIRNSYLIYPQFVKNQGGESSILLAIEVSVVPHADNTMRLVSYDTSASNISKTRKVVWEQDPRGLFVQVSAFGNLACFSEIPDKGDEYNTKGSTMVVDIRSGKAISLPGGGKCAIPRSNFVTAIGYTSAGKQLNGYDLDTKKSGAVPLSVAMDPRSLTITDDKNLSWKEYFEGGTWLLQLDVDSFRRDVNGFAVPTPSPTPNVTVR